MEESDDKKSVSMETAIVLKECRSAIEQYDLVALVKTAKAKKDFQKLDLDERELLCAGLIKLGEALTFCRDKNVFEMNIPGLSFTIKVFAEVRDYFVHHHLYHQFFDSYATVNGHIENLVFIQEVSKKLTLLEEKSGELNLHVLSKNVGPPKNDFPFNYSDFIKFMQNEYKMLNEKMEAIASGKDLSLQERTFLNNRVRNIFSLMLDMTNDNPRNRNSDGKCEDKKRKVEAFNAQFVLENERFAPFFEKLKTHRNALCHLEPMLIAPSRTDVQLVEFIKTDLQELEKKGYIDGLVQICFPTQKVAPILDIEMKEEKEKRERLSPERQSSALISNAQVSQESISI